MLFRLFSLPGRLAHEVNITFVNRRAVQPRTEIPTAGKSRYAWCLGLVVGALVVAAFALALAAEGLANPSPTPYSVSQLVNSPDVGNKTYASVTGQLHDWYVYKKDKQGNKVDAWYLLGSTSLDAWILVETHLSEDQVANMATGSTVTFTGMVRKDDGEVASAIKTLGDNVPSVNINKQILLREGQTPASAPLMFALAGASVLFGLVVFATWLVGYMVFRAIGSRQGIATGGFTGNMPVRITGLIPGHNGGQRAFDLKDELRVPVPEPTVLSADTPVELVWQIRGDTSTIPLMPGTTEAIMGTAYHYSGEQPAIRIRFYGFKVILAFDSPFARDTAFDQLRLAAKLTTDPKGAVARA